MTRTDSTTPIWGKIAIVALILIVGGGYVVKLLTNPFAGMDFSIYRLGAMTIFDNEGFTQDLYSPTLNDHGVDKPPFTYPPFAAMLFLPFAFMPLEVGMVIMVVGSAVVAWWISTIIYNYVNARGRELPLQQYFGRAGTIAVLTILVVAAGPWQRTLDLIQINPFITALILADFVRPATRVPRGVLIGIAGGVKLTPLVFGLILLVRRDWKGIATLGVSFAATVGIGFLVIREESLTFWFHAVHDTSRVGWFSYFDNVSIMGTLTHAGLQHHLTATALSVVQVALTLLIVLVTAVLLVPLIRARALMAQLALTAFMMLQISPISWSHHNTWYPLMLAAVVMEIFPLMYQRVSSFVFTLAVILATAALVGMYISPFWIVLALSPHFNADQILMVPEGSLGLMAGTMPYQLMYLFILVTFFVYLANRQLVERVARAAGAELAEAKYSR